MGETSFTKYVEDLERQDPTLRDRIEEAKRDMFGDDDCPGCGAPHGFPPAGPSDNLRPDEIEVIKSYLRPERTLSPKSAEAIETVLREAYSALEGKRRWWVKATVSAFIVTEEEGDAMQELCDLLSRERPKAGAPYEYEIHDIEAREQPQ